MMTQKNIHKEDINGAKALFKNLMSLGNNPENLSEIFTIERDKNLISLIEFMRNSSLNYLFDVMVENITPEEKLALNDMFLKHNLQDSLSIFHIANKENSTNDKKHNLTAITLRKHLCANYTMMYNFPNLRDKLYDLYSDSPLKLYTRCKSISHYNLLAKHMKVKTEKLTKDGENKINYKLVVLHNFLNSFLSEDKQKNPYINYGEKKLNSTSNKKDNADNQRDILEWARENILKDEAHNPKVINSAVSMLLVNGFSYKSLNENGFPKIKWEEDIQLHGFSKGWKDTEIYLGNHFLNIANSKKFKLLNSEYILQPQDWYHLNLIKSEYNSISCTDSEKQKINKIIENSIKNVSNAYRTPEGDIADSLIPLNISKKDEINKINNPYSFPKGRDSYYLKFAIEVIQNKGIDIYEIRENLGTGEKYSIFTNAFLGQNFLHMTTNNNKFVEFIEEFKKAPDSNLEIIENFFISKIKDIVFLTISETSKNNMNFKKHFPTLKFIVDNSNLSLKIAPAFAEALEESVLLNKITHREDNSQFFEILDKVESINSYLQQKSLFDKIKTDDSNNDNLSTFKL